MSFSDLFQRIRDKRIARINARRGPKTVKVVETQGRSPMAGEKIEMTPQQFITLFPPKKNHNACLGKGFHTRCVPTDGSKTIRGKPFKKIEFCECVQRQYRKSGMLIKIKEEMA